jgi:threonyl-tRNA synthetase
MSFPDSKQMTEYKKYLEEAAKRDHRKIGKEQELFFFSDLSPGSAFFLPMGMRIYNTLLSFIKVSNWSPGSDVFLLTTSVRVPQERIHGG